MSTPVTTQPVSGNIPLAGYSSTADENAFSISFIVPPLGCPPGLELLDKMDEIQLNQQDDYEDELKGMVIEVPNRHSIENMSGQRFYFAQEESDSCSRTCCQSHRSFIMHITTNDGKEVIRCERKFKCCGGCCWFADNSQCSWEMSVEAPVGTVIGYIRQQSSKWKTHLTLYDANRVKLYHIWSICNPVFYICCINDINFHVFDANDKRKLQHRIYKKWAGCRRECCTRADLYVCEFPGINVKEKALFICTTLLLDVIVFEPQKFDHVSPYAVIFL